VNADQKLLLACLAVIALLTYNAMVWRRYAADLETKVEKLSPVTVTR